MRKFIFFSILALMLFSCKKEPAAVPCNSEVLLIQVKADNAPVQELTYKGCNLYESVEEYSYKRYTYNSQDLLVKTEQALLFNPTACYIQPGAMDNRSVTDPRKAKFTQYYTYAYDNSLRLAKVSYYFIKSDNSELIYYQTFEYEGGYLKRNNLFSPQEFLTNYTLYTYDNNSNVTKEDNFIIDNGVDFKLFSTKKYEYDTKHNPFYAFAVEGIPGINTNKNNILKETSAYFYEGGPVEDSIQNTLYYNELGYPSKINNREYIYAGGSPVN
jgi:hypothetical protein